ncbi:DUF262 domain-containing protein [Parafannyhessea umbonata]|uniref:DUF262 domain-containing protein n=1 Tax=Parafannyhessea umbonata TaxID=604330 RepID=UPI003F961B15
MSQLTVDQKNIRTLLQDEDADYLIPDYQRPYAWGEDECSTLWDDLFAFAFSNNASDRFDKRNDYFLGPIVTFKNDEGRQEIIDGQQRLTTIMLLLRALYDRFAKMRDRNSVSLHDDIAACIWKSDDYGNLDMTEDGLKIKSEVASDNDKGEFLQILRDGKTNPAWKSGYAKNFRYFQGKIAEFAENYDGYSTLFASRIMRHVILLPIEAGSQDTALRIFSTLNDRGLPLSDADIFKSKLYKHFSSEGGKVDFVTYWKAMEEGTNDLLRPLRGTPHGRALHALHVLPQGAHGHDGHDYRVLARVLCQGQVLHPARGRDPGRPRVAPPLLAARRSRRRLLRRGKQAFRDPTLRAQRHVVLPAWRLFSRASRRR